MFVIGITSRHDFAPHKANESNNSVPIEALLLLQLSYYVTLLIQCYFYYHCVGINQIK